MDSESRILLKTISRARGRAAGSHADDPDPPGQPGERSPRSPTDLNRPGRHRTGIYGSAARVSRSEAYSQGQAWCRAVVEGAGVP